MALGQEYSICIPPLRLSVVLVFMGIVGEGWVGCRWSRLRLVTGEEKSRRVDGLLLD